MRRYKKIIALLNLIPFLFYNPFKNLNEIFNENTLNSIFFKLASSHCPYFDPSRELKVWGKVLYKKLANIT